MHPIVKMLTIIISCLLLTSCASWFTGKTNTRQVTINLSATSTINPNILGKPSPIAVDVYQLSDAADFSNADYQNFLDGTVKNVIQKKTYLVWPGTHKKLRLQLADNTKVIGMIANYRILNKKQWRVTQRVGWFTGSIDIKITNNTIVTE